jgi:hypothetical protein
MGTRSQILHGSVYGYGQQSDIACFLSTVLDEYSRFIISGELKSWLSQGHDETEITQEKDRLVPYPSTTYTISVP